MELQNVGRHKWSWGKIGLSVLALGAMLVIVADSCQPNSEDQWMFFHSKACTCQGGTLQCSGDGATGTGTYPNSKYCDFQSLLNKGLCACNNTDLVCNYSLDSDYNPKFSSGPTPPPTPPSTSIEGEVHWVIANSLVCGGSGQSLTPTPTSMSSQGEGGACLDPCDPNVSGSCEAGLNCEPKSQNSTNYICWNNSICNPTATPVPVSTQGSGGGGQTDPCAKETCGDGYCSACPVDQGCTSDCPPAGACTCGNGVCEAACGEDVASCPADCGAVP